VSRIIVLSPHRDDAAFSLYISLREWTRSGANITVLNFFTTSAYAPRASAAGAEAVSLIRKAEDRHVISHIRRVIEVRDCHLLDAPLRLGISFEAVFRPDSRHLPGASEADVAAFIRKHLSRALVIAPLGLGEHVDHFVVHSAAIRNAPPLRLAFYEDLPYATWIAEKALREKVRETEAEAHVKLAPAIIRRKHAAWQKQQAIAEYRSQISSEEAATIARFSAGYGGGERIWIPKRSRAWRLLTGS